MSIQFSSCRLIIKCLLINLWIYCEDWPPPDPLWRPSLPHKNFTECLWGEKLYMSGISLWNRWENYGKNNQRFDNDSYSLFFLPPPPPYLKVWICHWWQHWYSGILALVPRKDLSYRHKIYVHTSIKTEEIIEPPKCCSFLIFSFYILQRAKSAKKENLGSFRNTC